VIAGDWYTLDGLRRIGADPDLIANLERSERRAGLLCPYDWSTCPWLDDWAPPCRLGCDPAILPVRLRALRGRSLFAAREHLIAKHHPWAHVPL
jgi:hypothetical protein